MGKAIILNLPKLPRAERSRLSESVNDQLESINNDVNSWNGFIDVTRNDNGNYQFIAKCDNEVVRIKMQALLDSFNI